MDCVLVYLADALCNISQLYMENSVYLFAQMVIGANVVIANAYSRANYVGRSLFKT